MASYVLKYVGQDGNPRLVQNFGSDLNSALRELRQRRLDGVALRQHRAWAWIVFDEDDPELGYFDEDEAACA